MEAPRTRSIKMSSKRVPSVATFTVAMVLTSLVMVKAQDVEGSGSLDGLGDDEEGFDVPSRPTSLIEIPTPTVGISPTKTVYKPSISMDPETDPIYVSLHFYHERRKRIFGRKDVN